MKLTWNQVKVLTLSGPRLCIAIKYCGEEEEEEEDNMDYTLSWVYTICFNKSDWSLLVMKNVIWVFLDLPYATFIVEDCENYED